MIELLPCHYKHKFGRFCTVETSAAGDSDKINPAEAKNMTTVAELSRLIENKLHNSGKNASQAFWCEEKDIDKMELLQGDHVRLKTKGEGPFIGEICHRQPFI